MGETKPRKATYQDVLDAPPHKVAEILNGELILSPRPALPHASATGFLFAALLARFRRGGKPGGWIILFEPELHLGDDIVVPDLAGWRLERLPHVDDVPYFTLPPDWLCETLSRSTEKYDRADKLQIYAAHSVGHVWFVNPMRRTLEVLRRYRRRWSVLGVHRDDSIVRAEPFAAMELDLATLWADLKPKPAGTRASDRIAEYELDL